MDRTKRIVGTVLASLLWLVTSVLAVVDLLVARAWWLVVMGATEVNQWTGRVLDVALLLLGGIALLALSLVPARPESVGA